MSYQYGKMVMHNFGPFREIEFDFSRPGLTMIDGKIVGRTGCDNNGSGKSSLLECPVWITTGKLLRGGVSPDDVIYNPDSDEIRDEYYEGQAPFGCWGRQEIIGGPKEVVIERYCKHPKKGSNVYLFIDGEDVTRGTNTDTNTAIAEVLGIDMATLLNTVAFGARQDVRSFFTATESSRKLLLERLLGLEIYSKAHKLASDRAKSASGDLETKVARQAAVLIDADQFRTILQGLESEDDDIEYTQQCFLVRGLKKDCAAAEADEETAQAKVDTAFRAYDKHHQAYEKDLKTHAEAGDKLRKDCSAHDSAHAAAEAVQDSAKQSRRKLLKLKKAKKCPTCLQVLTEAQVKKTESGLNAIIEAQQKIMDVEDKARACARDKSIDHQGTAPQAPDSKELDQEKRALSGVRARVSEIRLEQRGEEKKLEAIEKARKSTQGNVDEIRAKITKLEEEDETLKVDIEELRCKVSNLQFWVEGFGNKGLKSFVIEAELPHINQSATVRAQQLLGDGTTVQVRATRQLKKGTTKEEMSILATIPNCARTYASASKGQRHRLDLALLLAFREMAERRSAHPFAQLFADEMFDGVDRAGIESVVEILQGVAMEIPVILVTHDDRLKSVGDRLVTVCHENGHAEIIER